MSASATSTRSGGRNAELPLYHERYCLVCSRSLPFMDRATVTWDEVATLPLCLPLQDTRNRRIYDRIFQEVGVAVQPALECNDSTVRLSHLRAGRLATVMPRIMAGDWSMPPELAAVPIVAPDASTMIGLIYRNAIRCRRLLPLWSTRRGNWCRC